jgi:hypothetical protein
MAFSWAGELARAKEALANRAWDNYFKSSVENSREMRTSYTLLGNIQSFIEWLESKASEEEAIANGTSQGGSFFMAVGGY